MTSFGELAAFIGYGITNIIIGDPIVTAILCVVLMIVVLWSVGIGKEGALIIVVPLILLFASQSFFPEGTTIIVWMILGIIAFMIFMKIIEG
jgi:hypothetical protein